MLELACDPRAAVAAAAAAPLAQQCAEASTLAQCRAAAGRGGLVVLPAHTLWPADSRHHAAVAAPARAFDYEDSSTSDYGRNGSDSGGHTAWAAPVAAYGDPDAVCSRTDAAHAAAAAAAGIRCEWQTFMQDDPGECRAVAGEPGARDLLLVDRIAAECHGSNAYVGDSDVLRGCVTRAPL